MASLFTRTVFANAQFDAPSFISQNCGISPDNFRTQLTALLKAQKDELIDLINRDYVDFLALSTNLNGVDVHISALKTPLTQITTDIAAVKDTSDQQIVLFNAKLDERRLIRETKVLINWYK